MAQSKALLRAKKKKAFACISKENFLEAQQLYMEICRTDPRDAEAWFLRGAVHGQLNQFDESIACCLRAIGLQPNHIDAHYNLAQAYMHLDKQVEAAASYRDVLRLQPDHAEANNTLGFILYSQGKHAEAQGYLLQALKFKPDHAEACANLGEILRENGAMQVAEYYYRRALSLNADIVKAQLGLGTICFTQGGLDEAMELFGAVRAKTPENDTALACCVMVHDKRREYEAAHTLLASVIDAGKLSPAIAVAYSRVARHGGSADKALELLETALTMPNQKPEETMPLHFNLGKAYDEAGEYDKAFSHYRQGNALAPSYSPPEVYLRRMDALTALFTPDFLSNAPRASNSSERPVFIVGMPRSGTTLTEQILSSHPAVFGAGEMGDLMVISSILPTKLGSSQEYPKCLENGFTPDILEASAQAYLDRLMEISPDALRVTDKMPHNFQHLGLIELLFPHARVIHCVRDPMDTCLSIYSYQFNTVHGYATDLTHLGQHYRKYQSLMQHWKQVLSIPILEVRYEDMVADQERVSRTLVEFCGLDWDENCLRFYENKRVVNTFSYNQVNRPIYKKSVERWKNYEKHLSPLKAALGLDE